MCSTCDLPETHHNQMHNWKHVLTSTQTLGLHKSRQQQVYSCIMASKSTLSLSHSSFEETYIGISITSPCHNTLLRKTTSKQSISSPSNVLIQCQQLNLLLPSSTYIHWVHLKFHYVSCARRQMRSFPCLLLPTTKLVIK